MPSRAREIFPVDQPMTIRAWLNKAGISEFVRPTLCLWNGKAVLREHWHKITISFSDIVTFITLPQGGEGGGGKILRSVVGLALMIAAPYAGAALAGAIGITGAAGVALMTAGVTLAGGALLNVLVPPPSPSTSLNNGFGNIPNASPTYSLQAQGNQARISQPIPVIYGRHIIYPDLAATPYVLYKNNEQYLHQLHCIGQGEYDLEQIRIEDTPLSSFEEIEYEIMPPGKPVTLFETDVVTVPEIAGQELLSQSDEGDWIGPFVANPAQTKCHQLSIDIILPRGLYYANDNGDLSNYTIKWQIEARKIDDQGVALGERQRLGSESFTKATTTPQRLTYDYKVEPGRYEVRAIRTDSKDTSTRAGHELRWAGLKAVLDEKPDFGDITLLAMKMRATDNLSQRASRMINCIVTRKLPIWDEATGWSAPQKTRSIAWALADIARSSYGGKLDDSRIDLAQLKILDDIWHARGDHFDAVFDQTVTVWEALSRTARCGRAVSFMQGGCVRFVRDEKRVLPVALFSPRNIVKNSLKIQYLLASDDTADSVTVEYFSNQTWKVAEETVSLSDHPDEQPARVRLFGCTEKQQAIREGKYMAAANRYRRRLVSFQTELEGLIPTYGDL
ncbi:host specificity factor TipJ family phage tail protein [Bartonella sp. DGB2]|uniref:host specificity factor TipJ family phage tail protein n=1 Tax=Bartonella sp. DGB2 TaxID=3388426 RepID=UPI00398FC527